jgi:uncharacterized protein YjbJ (UPF0337 family)
VALLLLLLLFTYVKGAAAMSRDHLGGQWKQLKGKVKEQWSKLTDDELDVITGKNAQLLGKLPEKHGYAKRRSR